MQNIDKIAMVAALVIVVGGGLWAVMTEDPGEKLAQQIQDDGAAIADQVRARPGPI